MQNVIVPQTLRKTKFFHSFMSSAALVIFAALLSLASVELQHWWPNDALVWSFLMLSLVFLVVSHFGSQLIGKKLMSRANAKNSTVSLSESFMLWMVIRLTVTTATIIFASAGYMLTSNLLLLLMALVAMLLLLSYRPSEKKFDDLLTKASKG